VSARALLAAALLAAAPLAARAQTPELALVGGSGVAGGTVAVVIQLSEPAGDAAVTADLDIGFPADRVAFSLPVSDTCRIAERLAATHQVGGRLLAPGLVSFAVFARQLEIAPLGAGPLASCDFRVLPEAPDGPAALTVEFAGLGDADGMELEVVGVGGEIVIGAAPPACIGDCTGDGVVTVDELVRGVRIVLGELPASNCPAFDGGDGQVTVSDLIAGVNNVLRGCPVAG